MSDLRRAAVQPVPLRGNEVLRVDDPLSLWVVDSGSVALFAVDRLPAGGGRRRYLFSLEPGDGLFGIEPGAVTTIVAVALEESVLRRWRRDSAEDPAFAAVPGAERLLQSWVRRWSAAFEAGAPALAGHDVEALHASVLQRLEAEAAREAREDFERFREREQHARDETRQAVGELTAVLQAETPEPPREAGLFAAAHAVGQASGVTLRSPGRGRGGGGSSDLVARIAAASHVRSRKVLLHDGWWREDCGPLLAFRGPERRPVALLPRAAGAYDLLDPLSRARGPLDEDGARELDPQAYQFYRPLPDDATRALDLIRFALRGRGPDLLAILLTAGGATLLGMFTPQAMALIVDRVIPDSDWDTLWQIGLGLLAAALGGALFRLSQGIAMLRLETAADTVTQSAVWDRLLNLQLSFFRRFSTGDLVSRVTAISQIRAYLSGTTLRSLFSSVVLLLNLALLVYYSPRLTLVALAVAALSAAVTVGSSAMILRFERRILELRGKFFGLMVQLIHGVAKLRVAAAEDRAFGRWARAYAALLRLELKQRTIQDAVQVANVALSTVSAIFLFSIAAALVNRADGGLSTGVFLAFHVAYGTFIGAIVNLSNTITDVMAIAILRERARPILEAVPEVGGRKADPGQLEGQLVLDRVSFRYEAEGPLILNDVTVRAGAGQFVALVGPSGSGKSTLMRLLLGFETPTSGSIFYDGQDLAGLDVHAVRRQLGVVLQDGRINAGSIFENIVCGTQIPLNDAWEAARATGFASEIEAMPMGMHTVISEGGTNLSGGQRQRLLLTRAMVHRPRVLLLDEATSALDNTTQALVTRSLSALQVTRLVIAHRLSTIRGADRIYVVEAGRIAEEGGFDELAAGRGLFARLMSRQMT
jgi:ATP-binding cassette subfamily C protein